MTKRILAMTLCLALTLLACACAASDVTVSAPESTDNKGGNMPPVSTMEQAGTSAPATQTSSQTVSTDLELEPTEPILPEERETTLEKVLSFGLGIDGLFDYGFSYYDDPSVANIYFPGFMYTNGDGYFYHVVDNKLVCLNDGAWLPFLFETFICDIEICDNRLFLMTNDGLAYEYDITNGLADASLVKKYVVFKQYEEYAHFGYIVSGRPTVQYYSKEGNVRFPDGPYYTLEKKELQDNELQLPYVYVESIRDGSSIQSVDGKINGWAVVEEAYRVLSATSDEITLQEANTPNGIGIFVAYDADGNLLSRYGIQYPSSTDDYKTKPCDRIFNQGGLSTLKEYSAHSFTIDSVVFEDLVNSNVWVDVAGNQYFAAYYLDRCDVYRINPGYSDRDYVTEWQKNEAEDSRIAPTSNASGSSASSVYFLDITREDTKTNALEMIRLDWDILPGNLTPRPHENNPDLPLELPQYLRGNNVSTDQTGIPYCKGGYHGADNFESEAARLLSDGTRQMTGNVSSVTSHQDYTLGLDCARFLCKAFEFSSGLAPWQLKRDYLEAGCGHEVDSITELEEMDVIISVSHAMFFSHLEPIVNNGNTIYIVWVYDVTSGTNLEKTIQRSTGYTEDQLADQGYHFYHVYPSYDFSATQHWTVCGSCGEYPQNYESHTISTSYLYNTTHHWRGCTANCGKKSHNALHNTSNFGACSVCGYNPNVLNTRPGTEVVLEQ